MSIRNFAKSLYLVPAYRKWVVRSRLYFLLFVKRTLRTFETRFAFETTVSHNLKGLRSFNPRIDLLIKPLSVLELMTKESRILVIGPRNEHDLFTLIGNGFSKDRVKGLDLISYSSLIDLGDMHATKYPDGAWDAVIVGWTLSYSSEPGKFAREMVRIVKPGGVLAIAVEYATMTEQDEQALVGYNIQETGKLHKRINSVKEILDLFSGHVDHVYFSHDAPLRRAHGKDGLVANVSNVAVIFSLQK
ncbi:MAG: class I SAM-dependent methyltransferase [Fibrobacterota bacterium]|nr:class I SAM-dependent methyltransferase [Fibrobacterota bacterium]